MDRIFYTTALKSGGGIHVNVTKMAVRDLEIVPGDQLKVTVEKTGKEGRRRPDAKFPQMKKPTETPKPKLPEKAKETETVPSEIIAQAFEMRRKGTSIEEIDAKIQSSTDYSLEEFSEKTRKELEEITLRR